MNNPPHMKETIISELKKLEVKQNIKILYAIESGSRAWGFASPDSDWDVRYIYVHPREWYLSIVDGKDNHSEMLPEDIDLSGWELRKTLRLFNASNPQLLEWLQSPIVYLEKGPTAERMRAMVADHFNPISCLNHYLHMAEGHFQKYLQNDLVRLKKYFYVLRPVLACDWIIQRNSNAPMEFDVLLQTQVSDPLVKTAIEDLLARKMTSVEQDEEPRIQLLNDYLEQKIKSHRSHLNTITPPERPRTEPLDVLLREAIEEFSSHR